MTSHFTHQHIESMAWTIDRQGIDAIPASALRELGFVAQSAGVRPGLVDLLVDHSAPAVVRNRAFGFITSVLGRTPGTGTDTTVTPERIACAA
jgi:hypothetical protein